MSADADAGIEPGLLACVHCGLCQQACPTYVELGTEADSPRGRIALIRALEEGRLDASDRDAGRHLDLCLGCRACETACPSGVPYGDLIEHARANLEVVRSRPRRAARTVLTRMLTSRIGLAPLRMVARLPGRALVARATGSRLLAFAAALPTPVRAAIPERADPDGSPRGTVLLLTGCVSGALFAHVTRAAAELLRRAGWRVRTPRGQGCCGALAAHSGQESLAGRQRDALASFVEREQADLVVTTAAGCGAHLAALGVRDALSVLADGGLPAPARSLPCRVAIHEPCHLLHGQGIQMEVHRLLRDVPGLNLVPLPEADMCCGSAGTYNLTQPEMAERLLDRKLGNVERSGADVIAAGNAGCLLQMRAGAIARGLAVQVLHPLELLAEAYGIGKADGPSAVG